MSDQVKHHVEVELILNGDEYLAWIITFSGCELKMWIGKNDDEAYGEMLNKFMIPLYS